MAVEPKIEHLKLIQTVVARMATNSFLLKGWTVTLVAALFAFGAKEADRAFIVVAWVPVLVFAGLDAYFLWRERLFRRLYEKVAAQPQEIPVDFSMNPAEYEQHETWKQALTSRTVLGFYLPVAGLLAILTLHFAWVPKVPVATVKGPVTITISGQ